MNEYWGDCEEDPIEIFDEVELPSDTPAVQGHDGIGWVGVPGSTRITVVDLTGVELPAEF